MTQPASESESLRSLDEEGHLMLEDVIENGCPGGALTTSVRIKISLYSLSHET